jgi:DNA-directed RNA polymerase II subunit RPB2
MADYEYDDGYGEEDTGISAEECWTVISSFFDTKSLVSQQIDSYDDFVQNTMQQMVDENNLITLDQNVPHNEDDPDPIVLRRFEIKFGQLLLAKPTMTEGDGETKAMLPLEARLRNLTYSSPIYLEMSKKVSVARERVVEATDDGVEEGRQVGETFLEWEVESGDEDTEPTRVFIGKLPVMLKSKYCLLQNLTDEELQALGECPYDLGGYFVINGSEKVLIAQERSAGNIVQCFEKKADDKTPYVAEIRSAGEKGSRVLSSMQIKLHKSAEGLRGGFGKTVKMTVPYVNSEIPIAIVFRALGVVSDEDILNHICYDRNDTQMLEMLKPSLEEAFVIQDREVALDFIGKRGSALGTPRDKRIKHARDVLQKELLPHISQAEGSETRKAFFIGYMIHRMLQVALGRREPDDRDHFGKKRLDLAGPLMAKLFRTLFIRLTRDIQAYLRKCVETGKEFNLTLGVKSTTITNGLKYSLATGNWGEQKKAAQSTAGVSQVLNRYTFASTLSHLRRTNTPIGRDGKIAKPRQLHNTHWGLVCPAETPEGQACGLVKNLALMCYVTVGSPGQPLIDFMVQRNMEVLEEYDPTRSPNATKIFVNGVWVGVHRDSVHLVNTVQSLKRRALIDVEVSLVHDIRDREFKIFTDAGRVCRPLFVIDNDNRSPNKGNLILTKEMVNRLEDDKELDLNDPEQKDRYFGWNGLLKRGAVEYLDAEEEETVMIAMTPEDLEISRQLQAGYEPEERPTELSARIKPKLNPFQHTWTHCEIHPSMILGICASIIPFPDHNQVCLLWRKCTMLTFSLRVTRINRPWASKRWAFFLPTSTSVWTPWRISSTTRKNHWRPRDRWSSSNSASCRLARTPSLQSPATRATIRKTR